MSYSKDKDDALARILYDALLIVSDRNDESHCEKYNVKFIVESIVKSDKELYKRTKHIFNKLYVKLLADGF